MLVPANIMKNGCTIVCNENTNSLRIEPSTQHDENNDVNDEELHEVNNLLKCTNETNSLLEDDSDDNNNDELNDFANQLPNVIQCNDKRYQFLFTMTSEQLKHRQCKIKVKCLTHGSIAAMFFVGNGINHLLGQKIVPVKALDNNSIIH
jgi:hypothetical protein